MIDRTPLHSRRQSPTAFMPVILILLAMSAMHGSSPACAGETSTPPTASQPVATILEAAPAAVVPVAPVVPIVVAGADGGSVAAVSNAVTRLLGTRSLDATLSAAVMFGVASLAPAVLLMTTCFVRMSIVLALVRQGLGTPNLPSNQILTSLALFLSALVMWPVWTAAYRDGVEPYQAGRIELAAAYDQGTLPVRRWMATQIEHSGNRETMLFFLSRHRRRSGRDAAARLPGQRIENRLRDRLSAAAALSRARCACGNARGFNGPGDAAPDARVAAAQAHGIRGRRRLDAGGAVVARWSAKHGHVTAHTPSSNDRSAGRVWQPANFTRARFTTTTHEESDMTDGDIVELVRQAILSGLLVIAPVLLVGFAVAAITGLLQAATGIHEPLVGLVPRLVAMAAMLVLAMPWMVERMVDLFRTVATP